jgi:hypothetical protein
VQTKAGNCDSRPGRLNSIAGPAISFEGRRFVSIVNSDDGDVGDGTIFEYHHRGDVVWATYSGAAVRFGTLLARVDAAGNLDMRYQHISADGLLKAGRCQSRPEILPDGRLRLHEQWQWTEGGDGRGASVIEELAHD